MGERDTTVTTEGPSEELFDPALGELDDDDFEALAQGHGPRGGAQEDDPIVLSEGE